MLVQAATARCAAVTVDEGVVARRRPQTRGFLGRVGHVRVECLRGNGLIGDGSLRLLSDSCGVPRRGGTHLPVVGFTADDQCDVRKARLAPRAGFGDQGLLHDADLRQDSVGRTPTDSVSDQPCGVGVACHAFSAADPIDCGQYVRRRSGFRGFDHQVGGFHRVAEVVVASAH